MLPAVRVSRPLMSRHPPHADRIAARLAWALALTLALLGAQAHAQAHLLGHAADALQHRALLPGDAGGTAPAPHDGGDHASACLDCLALLGIDMPLGGGGAAPGHAAASFRQPAGERLPSPDALLPRPRCRAPPGFLPFAHFA